MSSTELVQWQAFAEVEPFGEARADLRSALICKVLADINTPKGKRKATLSDFMLNFEREAQSPEAMIQQVEFANMAYDGLDLREKDSD